MNNIIIKELQAKYSFVVQPEYQASLLNWLEYSKGLKVADSEIIVEEHLNWTKEDVLQEVVNEGQCEGCDMPEFIIQHEINAGDMKPHLICAGCGKHCDGGDQSKDNQYTFPSPKYGAWVFWKGFNSERVEEWYCPDCKFELLCGDCGGPNLDLADLLCHKPEGEEFSICVDCAINRLEEEHQENHFGKGQPDPDCSSCQDFVDKWPAESKPTLESKELINYLIKKAHCCSLGADGRIPIAEREDFYLEEFKLIKEKLIELARKLSSTNA